MSIWNKILIGLVFIASAGLLYMAARDLKTRQTWYTSAVKHQDALKQVLAENEQIEQGSDRPDAPKGIVQLRRELHRVQLDRGRVWRKCDPKSVSAEGAVKLGIPSPEGADKPPPHGITAKARVYLFDGTDVKEGGRFLGEFVATEIAERELGLQPTRKLDADDVQRLSQAQGKARQAAAGWTMYEEMPPDEHDVFASLKEEDLRAMLPQSTAAEYVKDGKPAEAKDPQDRRVDGKYVRRLRDYSQLLERYSRERTELLDARESGNRDKQGVEEALADSKKHEEFTRNDIARLKADLAKAKSERDAVAEHLKRLDTSLAQQVKANAQAIDLNQAMAAEITRRQLEAARLIDRRTAVMAQAGAGR
jgi:hypothetical protein